MQAIQILSESERISSLRQAILRRAPGILPEHLDLICNSVNTKRRYFIKATSNIEKFMNLVTRELIISDDSRIISEILPIYGSFDAPYFEKIGTERRIVQGNFNSSVPAAAIKIRVGVDGNYLSSTYSLIIFLVKYDISVHGL